MKKKTKIFVKAIVITFSIFALLLIVGYVYIYVLPKGPTVTQAKPMTTGTDSFVMYAHKNSQRKSIRVWTYKPKTWQNSDKILFVMHGGGRNADDYLNAWKEIAEKQKLLIVAPEFASKFAKFATNDYQEGNLFTFFGTRNSPNKWAYAVIENIFDRIKKDNQFTHATYDIFGHSAGGQFVHRMVMLMPQARISTAIAANAGFYTFPDETLKFPYGLKNTPVKLKAGLTQAFQKNLIILLGAKDNNPKLGVFRKTDLAMKQGGHRLARGSNFYQAARQLQAKHQLKFRWKIDTVANVGHNYRKMSQSAVRWLETTP